MSDATHIGFSLSSSAKLSLALTGVSFPGGKKAVWADPLRCCVTLDGTGPAGRAICSFEPSGLPDHKGEEEDISE